MHRPNRNIEIFSLSVLDLFSAAMGAFIAMFVILLPYYQKVSTANEQAAALARNVAALTATSRQAQQNLATCQIAADRDRQSLARDVTSCNQAFQQQSEAMAALQVKANSTFLVVVIDWPTQVYDIDLHVIDPQGREFDYNRRTIAGSQASLSYDNTTGPGIEMWQDPGVMPGTYCVAYILFSGSNPAPVTVKGKVFYRSGAFDLQTAQLRLSGNRLFVGGAMVIGSDGNLSVTPGAKCAQRRWDTKTDSGSSGERVSVK